MIIKAKYCSTCPECKKFIAIGDTVSWNKGEKAVHENCQTKTPDQIIKENMDSKLRKKSPWVFLNKTEKRYMFKATSIKGDEYIFTTNKQGFDIVTLDSINDLKSRQQELKQNRLKPQGCFNLSDEYSSNVFVLNNMQKAFEGFDLEECMN